MFLRCGKERIVEKIHLRKQILVVSIVVVLTRDCNVLERAL